MSTPVELLDRAVAALAELRRLRCTDPAAARANETVRLVAHTLECFYVPELAAVSEHVGGAEPVDRRPPRQPRQP